MECAFIKTFSSIEDCELDRVVPLNRKTGVRPALVPQSFRAIEIEV